MNSRNQIRRLPAQVHLRDGDVRCSRGGATMDAPLPQDRDRCLRDQRLLGDHRRRSSGAAGEGATDFLALQKELEGPCDKIVMVAFDLLYLDGQDLGALPLFERKAHLEKLVGRTPVQFSGGISRISPRE